MQTLKALVVVMGVLIIAGVAVIVATIVSRATRPGAAITAGAAVSLDEPDGTHVGETALENGALALTLVGGGPDRVVVVDLASGRVVRRVSVSK